MIPAAPAGVHNPPDCIDLSLNLARQTMYRFASLSFLDPRLGSWSRLQALQSDHLLTDAAAFLRSLPNTRARSLARGERPLKMLDPESVLRLVPDSEHAANARYEAVFGLLVSSNCPPYETEYINGKFAFQRSNTLADVSGYYHAFGLKLADRRPERPDHVAIELEFMACLLGLERDAANRKAQNREEALEVCRGAQVSFLKDHLAWWASTFALLVEKADDGGFYGAAAAFLAALMAAERALLGVLPASQAITPSVAEGAGLCEGCELTR